MASRVYLALGAAVLAFLTGVTAVGGSSRPGDPFPDGVSAAAAATPTTDAHTARIAEEHPVVPPARTSSAKLRKTDTIELDAEALTLTRADHTVTVLSMRDGGPTIATLTRLLGTPKRAQTAVGDGGRCLPAGTTYTWGGALRVAALASKADLGNALEVRVLRSRVTTRSGSVVELTGPDGVRVGDDIGERIHDAPADDRAFVGSDTDPAWQLVLAQGWPSDRAGAGTNGVSALTDGGTVTVIGSPMPVHATVEC